MDDYQNPEPVPPASQLAVLPFLAAVDGYLRENLSVPRLRLTMHRSMTREGRDYLQQICPYIGDQGIEDQSKVGRFSPVNSRVIGAAYESRNIWRTKKFGSVDELNALIERVDGDSANSYLAVPFLGINDAVVLILYADCEELNFFADDKRVERIAYMGQGLCRLFDGLQKEPFPQLRNFPLQKGSANSGEPGLYPIHEPCKHISPPKFQDVIAFNYEASVA
jgi:hypothetical protein